MMKIDDFSPMLNINDRISALKKKNFITDGYLNEEFSSVYKMYSNYFMNYLDSKIKLKSIDQQLVNSNLFPIVKDVDKNIYQKFSNYNYFFLRSNLYIEKLDDEYIKEILDRVSKNNFTYDEFAKEMIEKTYVNVLDDDNIDALISYGPRDGNYFAKTGSIVLGCMIDNSDEDDDFTRWLDREKKIFRVVELINELGKDKFDVDFSAFYYNFSENTSIE